MSIPMKDQKKSGVLLSYLNIVLSMGVNIILTPMLIAALSDDTYSLYKVMQSLAGPLAIFNLGLATVATRCVARYQAAAQGNIKEKQNTLAMSLIVACAMSVLVLAAGLMLMQAIPGIYGSNYSEAQIKIAKRVYFVFTVSAAINIVTDVFRGCIAGRERFAVDFGSRTMYFVLKLGLTVSCLKLGLGVLCVALIDLLINLVVLVFCTVYSVQVLQERPKLYFWDWRELRDVLTFTAAIILQTIVNQTIYNVDLMILGAKVEEKHTITMYSSALSIYGVYNTMILVFSDVFFPQAVHMVENEASSEKLLGLVVKAGRIQATIAVGVLGGFGLFGRNFIELWIGSAYSNAYFVALILMLAVTIPLVQSVCISILDAKLKRMCRSVVLCMMAGLNVVATVYLVDIMGFWGAVLATTLSLLIGHGLLMNIYYQKAIGLDVIRMLREIFRGSLSAGIVAAVVCLPLALFVGNSWLLFLVKCLAFCGVYGGCLYLWGWNDQEKSQFKKLLKMH